MDTDTTPAPAAWAGKGERYENPEYFAFAKRVATGAMRRAARAENVETDLAQLLDFQTHVDRMVQQAVDAMRAADPEQASWAAIGRAAGISRQAAQLRYGKRARRDRYSVESTG